MKKSEPFSILDCLPKDVRGKLIERFSSAVQQGRDTRCSNRETNKRLVILSAEIGLENHQVLFNALLFLNIANHDLSTILVSIIHERDEWTRRLSLRSLALILYELGEDVPQVFGKKFRDALTNLKCSEALLGLLGKRTKGIGVFSRENHTLLKKLRTVAGAHRDHDALAVLEAIDSIELFDLVYAGIEFGELLVALEEVTPPILELASVSLQTGPKQKQNKTQHHKSDRAGGSEA